MYDIYGDVVVTTKDIPITTLLEISKKIYKRSKFLSDQRTLNIEWKSPFVEKEFDKFYLNKEGAYKFYGHLLEGYYSPRYEKERREIKEYFKEKSYSTLGLVGAGISPFSIVLAEHFQKITEYEINLKTKRYSKINCFLNLKENIFRKDHEYDNERYDVIIDMVPYMSLKKKLNYNFKNELIIYHLVKEEALPRLKRILSKNYLCEVDVRRVRDYSKEMFIYRVTLKN